MSLRSLSSVLTVSSHKGLRLSPHPPRPSPTHVSDVEGAQRSRSGPECSASPRSPWNSNPHSQLGPHRFIQERAFLQCTREISNGLVILQSRGACAGTSANCPRTWLATRQSLQWEHEERARLMNREDRAAWQRFKGTLANARLAAGVRAQHSASPKRFRDPRRRSRAASLRGGCSDGADTRACVPQLRRGARTAQLKDAGECAGCRARAACGPVSAAVFLFARARPHPFPSVPLRLVPECAGTYSLCKTLSEPARQQRCKAGGQRNPNPAPSIQVHAVPIREYGHAVPIAARRVHLPAEVSGKFKPDGIHSLFRGPTGISRNTGNVIGPQGQLSTSGNPLTESRSGSRERT
ncbi:hypothetical protein B0H17DRAFT_1135592 [Mycena rosella]|uniref:Uncharacterized protein n=1 Tax=Mycena rosella TaxID=1033263 RepID=A0AAD7GFF4_MYCRO|nr:hypothetical protein B0H17DRAFT_1135592 [Mycena rosella]